MSMSRLMKWCTSGGGLTGNGWVGQVSRSGACGTGRSSIGNSGFPVTRSRFGYLCVEGMHLGPVEEAVDPDTGEIATTARWVVPTHYKCPQSGALLPVENPEVWVYLDDGEAVG